MRRQINKKINAKAQANNSGEGSIVKIINNEKNYEGLLEGAELQEIF